MALAASSYGGPGNLPKLRVTPRATWPPLKRGWNTLWNNGEPC